MTEWGALASELESLFDRGVDAPLSHEAFGALALRAFRHQWDANPTYRAFCAARGVHPDTVFRWEQVPAVPAAAFKEVDLWAGGAGDPEAVFLTSGTTAGVGRRGRHLIPRVSLYRASALATLQAHLIPEDRPLPVLSLIPSPADAPESSLSSMMGFVADRWGSPTRWLAHPDQGVDAPAFLVAARDSASHGAAVLVAGTAFAFVHLLDAMARDGARVFLPEGSRLMETGGFKGRSREVARSDLYAGLEERLGIPAWRMVNEYGMTELLSQMYEPTLREGPASLRGHVAPPWLRVHALDPLTLEPLPEGRVGVLAFFDLANVGSVCHVLTQDLGWVAGGRLRLQGREAGAEPRGCSLALEDFLAARGSVG